ncbi:MAG: radical SAM protein [Bryobacteraceae bacterium]|jgi:radical SAM protein with 4Fe4S-binding SPASM domain
MFPNGASPDDLTNLTVAVTNRCNLSCGFCCSMSSAKSGGELETPVLLKVMRTAGRSVRGFVFTGGEPFLRADLESLAGTASELFPKVAITTNGVDLTSSQLRWVKGMGIGLVISLEGLEKTHDSARGAGAFRKVMDTLCSAAELGIPLSLHTIIGPRLRQEADTLVSIARAVGAEGISFQRPKLVGRARSQRDFSIKPAEYKELVAFVARLQAANRDMLVNIKDALFSAHGADTVELCRKFRGKVVAAGCRAGICYLYIAFNGDVRLCPFIPTVLGNVRKDDLYDIWSTSILIGALRRREQYLTCKDCLYWPLCRGCRAEALARNRSLFGADPCCWRYAERG